MSNRLAYTLALLLLLLLSIAIAKLVEIKMERSTKNAIQNAVLFEKSDFIWHIRIEDTVRIAEYFDYMDSLVTTYDSLTKYPLSEHLLVNTNPWIIDTLANTDYYRMMQRDSFVYDQCQMIVLKPSDSLIIPDSWQATSILESFAKTRIEINLPEFKLRIYQDSTLLQTFPIRIGQNKKKYLKMGDRFTDLKTIPGKGQIIGFRKNPDFYNPETGKKFFVTRRDDGKTTLLPQIPWIVTEINGIKNGQLIHPTTNPETLGKAYSNGCIGVKEADAWQIYYQCLIGTKINIRYDLKINDINGSEVMLKDVYHLGT